MAYKSDDHNEKFSFMEVYFKVTEVLLKDNGVIDYSFTCIKCLPTKKLSRPIAKLLQVI